MSLQGQVYLWCIYHITYTYMNSTVHKKNLILMWFNYKGELLKVFWKNKFCISEWLLSDLLILSFWAKPSLFFWCTTVSILLEVWFPKWSLKYQFWRRLLKFHLLWSLISKVWGLVVCVSTVYCGYKHSSPTSPIN